MAATRGRRRWSGPEAQEEDREGAAEGTSAGEGAMAGGGGRWQRWHGRRGGGAGGAEGGGRRRVTKRREAALGRSVRVGGGGVGGFVE